VSAPASLFDRRFRTRLWWPGIAALAAFTYLYSLDGLYIPHIGDEAPYIQIVRLTAESGQWLPLETASGLENTKPPALFWLGIVSTDWARNWSLFRLRFPIVVCTFLTAGLVFLLARRMSGDGESGYVGALAFLGFASTFQYGRPFLTNLPETLFVFFPFFLLTYFRNRIEGWGIWFWLLAGLSVGVASLFKSFVLVAPVGVAFGWGCLVERRWHLGTFLKKDALGLTLALLLAIACFALWPALDPDPASVIRQFVLEENLGKLGGESYLSGLFAEPYPLYRIWLGHLANAGLFALPLVYLALKSVGHRRELSWEEKILWIFVLSFLIVYTVPSQRQENYLLPTVPALAVLLGVHWKQIKLRWFYLFHIPVLLALLLVGLVIHALFDRVLPAGSYRWWQLALPVLALLATAGGLLWNRISGYTFHLAVFLAIASLAVGLAPFDGPIGRYHRNTVAALEAKTVYVPSNFVSKYERHRFILPGARIEGYFPSNTEHLNRLLRSGQIVAIERPLGQTVAGPFQVYGKRLTLRSRQRRGEIAKILFERELDLLVQQEIIVQRRPQ
jgi:4-amino-4-deoxy-L-arabinose transferase-like glycosyltransferase